MVVKIDQGALELLPCLADLLDIFIAARVLFCEVQAQELGGVVKAQRIWRL